MSWATCGLHVPSRDSAVPLSLQLYSLYTACQHLIPIAVLFLPALSHTLTIAWLLLIKRRQKDFLHTVIMRECSTPCMLLACTLCSVSYYVRPLYSDWYICTLLLLSSRPYVPYNKKFSKVLIFAVFADRRKPEKFVADGWRPLPYICISGIAHNALNLEN